MPLQQILEPIGTMCEIFACLILHSRFALKQNKTMASAASNEIDDPHHLHKRFVQNQKDFFSSALVEIRQGEKRGCWLWFVLPTAPFIVNGVERGSSRNRHFALRGDACVKAYLQFQDKTLGVDLRTNYLTIVRAVKMQLQGGNTLSHIFGPMDDMKVVSSLKLFERIALEMKDKELAGLCRGVLDM